jgi:hypothetical protein
MYRVTWARHGARMSKILFFVKKPMLMLGLSYLFQEKGRNIYIKISIQSTPRQLIDKKLDILFLRKQNNG